MIARELHLLPPPRRIVPGTGDFAPSPALRTAYLGDLASVPTAAFVSTRIPAQGYVLEISREEIHVDAPDTAGAFHAAMTLRQILRQCPHSIPCCRIEDHPSFPTRGVMLDISRDKVPTMETLFGLVDLLAELKFNHLELYTEHTFAYQNHREVWQDASPMTADEIRELDAYCRVRFIELVPNQNSFGHLHRWLTLPRYRDLAECPDGFVTPWNERRPDPFSLNPLDPRSIQLIEELYAELLPNFASRKFNVGCDETFDLGQGRSKAECERLGKGRVYLDFLLKIHEQVKRHGRTMHFWGDIVLNHPELISELPSDVVALVWGYEANHPFAGQCAAFAHAGLPFYVCPGTSTWNSLSGRSDNALANLASAAENGLKHGAAGFLVADWGDNGHWQPLSVSYLPYAAAAAAAWRGEIPSTDNLLASADRHVFCDDGGHASRLAHDLGNAYLQLDERPANASMLFRLLRQEPDDVRKNSVSRENLERAKHFVQTVFEQHPLAKIGRADAALICAEFMLVGSMLEGACERALRVKAGESLAPLAREFMYTVEEFRRIWLARNRPGGLSDSLRVLEQRFAETQ